MDIEEIREYCLSLHRDVEECMPFGEEHLVFKIGGKMFLLMDINTRWVAVKCDPALAIELRDRYEYVSPAWHMNKKHWNGIDTISASGERLKEWILHSYTLVEKKSKRK